MPTRSGYATELERIAALEIQMGILQAAVKESTEAAERRHATMDGKLDDLLFLKNRGVGAFWLASALVGTGIIGSVVTMYDWWKGFLHG